MTKKILVVDDNQVLLKFVRNLLEREGFEVQTAEDGLAALNLVPSFLPDFLIVDLVLPKISGDKLCRTVRKMERMQDCAIIVLSAALAEIDTDPIDICADAYIAKSSFPQMANHILDALARLAAPHTADEAKLVMGIESVHARRLTRELLARNHHLSAILDSLTDEIVEICEGRIVYANHAALRFLGLPEEELLTTDPTELFNPKVRPRVRAMLANGGKGICTLGKRSPVQLNDRMVTIKRVPIDCAEKSCIIRISDVTARIQLEMQLQHSQKMEAIGTIASGVAHNFRNTLATIKMNNELIQLGRPADPELAQITQRIDTSIQHAIDLVEGLMNFSRKKVSRELGNIDLAEVIGQIHQIIRASFDKAIQIELDVPESLSMHGDSSGLSLALLNLCTNARDAMPDGGVLTISARINGEVVEVCVADTGIGMNRETMKNCFEPFFTTKQPGQGTGLGLSTTYGIIESHGGQIDVASTPGKGTVFCLHLPIAAVLKEEPELAGSYEVVSITQQSL
jgi:PAS domain S-box-containing protein